MPGSVRPGLGLGRGVGSAAQTGPSQRSTLCRRKAYRRGWERTAFSCSLDKKDVLMFLYPGLASPAHRAAKVVTRKWIEEENLSC